MIIANSALDSITTKFNEPSKSAEPNPPQWPESVTIITSDMKDEEAQKILDKLQDYCTTKVTVTADMTDNEKLINNEYFVPKEHFSSQRKAIFFEPREDPYKVDVQVGYYVQVLGLGASASDVKFADDKENPNPEKRKKKGPYCPAYFNDKLRGLTTLDTFWRSAENFTNQTEGGQLWAVSQAAPIRRIHAEKDFTLHDNGAPASGGHLANAQVDGTLVFGSQQQFCSRSVTVGDAINLGVWSNVFVDTVAPENCLKTPKEWGGNQFDEELSLETRPYNWRADWSKKPLVDFEGASTTVNVPKTTVEKCFVAMEILEDNTKKYFLHVPKPRIRSGDELAPLGADLSGATDDKRPFENVYVARAEAEGEIDNDVARKINTALKQGKDVVLSPGIYHLKESINIVKNDQVLLGVGMATLTAPPNGEPCIQVPAGIEGVRIGGMMFAASRIKKVPSFYPETTSFIEFGQEGVTDPGNPQNPGVLTDIFCRVGGDLDREVSLDVMVRIHQGNVIGDNLWLWRADHVELADGELPNFPDKNLDYHQVVMGECPCKTGLEVNGDNVVIHGLAVEHTEEDHVVWNGANGQVYFYQCELPYDVDQNFGANNFVAFRVNGENHQLGGAGVYSNFRDYNVIVKTGIVHPSAFDSNAVINPFTVHLDNGGRIMTVVSDGSTYGGGPVYDSNFRDYNVLVKTGTSAIEIHPFTVHLDNIGRIMTVVLDKSTDEVGPSRDRGKICKYLPSDEEEKEHAADKGNKLVGLSSKKLTSVAGSSPSSPTPTAVASQ